MGSGNGRPGRRPRRGEIVDDGSVGRRKQGRQELGDGPYSFMLSSGNARQICNVVGYIRSAVVTMITLL